MVMSKRDCGNFGWCLTPGKCTRHTSAAPTQPEETAAYWRGRYEGMIEALRKTHTDEQLAEMGIVL
jgi:hypothetical protein